MVDGNKRIALTSMTLFLLFNGYLFYAGPKEAVTRCVCIARSERNVDAKEVARWVRRRSLPVDRLRAAQPEEARHLLRKARIGQRALGDIDQFLNLVEALIQNLPESPQSF